MNTNRFALLLVLPLSLLAGTGHAGPPQEISPQCGVAVGLTIAQLSQTGTDAAPFRTFLQRNYARIACSETDGLIRVVLKKHAVDDPRIRDGEDYFLISPNGWRVLEKWVDGAAWIDPAYSKEPTP